MVLVNETFVKRYYPNGEILGRSLKIPMLKDEPPYTLAAPGSDGRLQMVGVVADSLNDGLDKPVKPAIFLPYSLYMWMHTQILVESRVDPQSILHSVRRQIVSVNADQQANGQVDDLEMWIRREPEMGQGTADFDSLWSIFRAGAGVGGCRPVQCGFVLGRTADQRVRHPHGIGRAKEGCVVERAGFGRGERRFWIAGRTGAQSWTEPADLPLGGE